MGGGVYMNKRVVSYAIMAVLIGSVPLVFSQQPPPGMKVYISADMEGIGEVSTWEKQSNPKGADYEKFRRLMTLEVNAATDGAFDAGATYVLVSDSHWDGQNIDPELLDKRAELVRSWPRRLDMMEGIDDTFAAAVFVGYHSGEGYPDAILAHTHDALSVLEVKLNGVPVPEAGINAAIAGEFGVPVVFVSGDQAIAEQCRQLLGPIETAVVKQALGFFAGIMVHPEESQRRIREGVKRGVERRRQLSPYRLARPVKLEMSFKNQVIAELISYLPGVERPRGNTVALTLKDMLEAAGVIQVFGNINIPLGVQ